MNFNDINSIIACYAIIIKNNIVILIQNMNSIDRKNMISLLLESKKTFQRFYQCVMFIYLKNFKRDDYSIFFKHIMFNISNNEFKTNNTFEDNEL